MNRLTMGVILSGVFHVALLGWHMSETKALPKVNVNPGKTSIAVQVQTKSRPKPVKKPTKQVVKKPEPKPTVEPKEIKRPEDPTPTSKDIEPVEKKQTKKPVDVEKPQPTKPKPKQPVPKQPTQKKEQVKQVQKPSVAKEGAKWVKKADYRTNPSPQYPDVSRERGDEGTVILRVRVDKEGRPTDIRVRESSGYDRLDDEAVDTVKRWRFTPAEHAGVKIRSTVLIPIRFRLNE